MTSVEVIYNKPKPPISTVQVITNSGKFDFVKKDKLNAFIKAGYVVSIYGELDN